MGTVGDYSVRVRSRFCIPAMPTARPERACWPVGYSLRGVVFLWTCLCRLSHAEFLLKQLFAQYLEEMKRAIHLERSVGTDSSREHSFQKPTRPSFISLALHPCEAQHQRGASRSYLLTYEEIGTTSNPSCFCPSWSTPFR